MNALRIDRVRARLTAFYVAVLAAALVIVGGLIYVLLARALYARIDESLHALVQITATSLANDLGEGQDIGDAARSTVDELSSRQRMLVIYDDSGNLLAEGGRDDDLTITLPAPSSIPTDAPILGTVVEQKDDDDRHRLALRRVTIPSHHARYIVIAGSSLEPTDEELESLREILAYVVPIALMVAGIGGWFLARQSLSPIAAMVAAQRQFMADASHELRTPVATTRTAANVALQQRHREEDEYRETLGIIEQQATRLSRIVDDMFTLARADAGTYPVRQTPMYLDEVVDDVVKAARVLASTRNVAIEASTTRSAALTGDEDLIRRLMVNLLDNAIRFTAAGSSVRIDLEEAPGGYALSISDHGPGIAAAVQPHIFERFYRVDSARARGADADGGAGLGLALARWIAEAHGGHLTLARSSAAGTTFTAFLPHGG